VFVDRENPVDSGKIWENIDHPNLTIVSWPPQDVTYPEEVIDSKNKFGKAQRYKIMAGFVHVPAMYVGTPYWLKLDADAIAQGQDNWIDPQWFNSSPTIIAHRWGFTKPANLIQRLDDWSAKNHLFTSPLNLPLDSPESERISHPRISSWCALFNTKFTQHCSSIAENTCGRGMLPVPSQDTYLWYMATQTDPESIVRVNMKSQGWTYRSSFSSVKEEVIKSLSLGGFTSGF
jgi:hypothetical protein